MENKFLLLGMSVIFFCFGAGLLLFKILYMGTPRMISYVIGYTNRLAVVLLFYKIMASHGGPIQK